MSRTVPRNPVTKSVTSNRKWINLEDSLTLVARALWKKLQPKLWRKPCNGSKLKST